MCIIDGDVVCTLCPGMFHKVDHCDEILASFRHSESFLFHFLELFTYPFDRENMHTGKKKQANIK